VTCREGFVARFDPSAIEPAKTALLVSRITWGVCQRWNARVPHKAASIRSYLSDVAAERKGKPRVS
jgi:cytochrome b